MKVGAGLDRTKVRSGLSEAEAQGIRLRVFPAIVKESAAIP